MESCFQEEISSVLIGLFQVGIDTEVEGADWASYALGTPMGIGVRVCLQIFDKPFRARRRRDT